MFWLSLYMERGKDFQVNVNFIGGVVYMESKECIHVYEKEVFFIKCSRWDLVNSAFSWIKNWSVYNFICWFDWCNSLFYVCTIFYGRIASGLMHLLFKKNLYSYNLFNYILYSFIFTRNSKVSINRFFFCFFLMKN